MRYHWKGTISFGLVSIPIMLVPVEKKSATISFHLIDKRDSARIKYQRINANTGKVVPWEQIEKGYEYDKETIIPVPEEVLKRVSGEHSIDIENFIDKKNLDILSVENNYYIVPGKKAEKGYVILREALRGSNKIGIAKIILSTKEYLAAVVPEGDALVLCLLRYDNEITRASELELPVKDLRNYKVTSKEIDIAKKLITSMSKPWKPKQYVDEYQAIIHKWADEVANNLPHTLKSQKRKKNADNNIDFVALLRKSLGTKPKVTKVAKAKKKAKVIKKPPVRAHKSLRQSTRH